MSSRPVRDCRRESGGTQIATVCDRCALWVIGWCCAGVRGAVVAGLLFAAERRGGVRRCGDAVCVVGAADSPGHGKPCESRLRDRCPHNALWRLREFRWCCASDFWPFDRVAPMCGDTRLGRARLHAQGAWACGWATTVVVARRRGYKTANRDRQARPRARARRSSNRGCSRGSIVHLRPDVRAVGWAGRVTRCGCVGGVPGRSGRWMASEQSMQSIYNWRWGPRRRGG